MKTLTVSGDLQQMAASVILDYISPDVHSRILLKDSHPEYRAYRIGHEGTANGARLIGIGKTVLKWAKAAVQQLVQKLQIGTPLFSGHGLTNGHAGRVPVGEVVGKALIDDSAVALVYIPPDHRSKKLDIASIEAQVEIIDGELTSEGITSDRFEIIEVSGVALGNSSEDTPAMPRATLIGALAMMAEEGGRNNQGDESMNLEEIRAAIAKLNCQPSDLFPPDTILRDPAVKEHNNNEFYARKRIEQEFKSEIDGLKDQIKALETEKQTLTGNVTTLNKQIVKGTAKEEFAKILEKRKITDTKQKEFLVNKFSEFEPVDPGKLEDELNAFADSKVKEFDQFAAIFGFKKEEQSDSDENKGLGQTKNTNTGDDMTDPKINDQIPG